MRFRIFCSLMAALAALCMGGFSSSVAQEVAWVAMNNYDYNAMQVANRLTEVETRLASLGGGDIGDTCGCEDWCGTCTSQGVTASGELLFLRGYSGDQGQVRSSAYVAAPRVTVGWVRNDGLGLRVRGFSYSNDTSDTGSSSADDFDVSYGDFEVTDKFQLGCWSGVLSGGARLGHYKEAFENEIDFTGWGPVIAAEVVRPVMGNVHLFGSARYSFLFGHDSVFSDERESNSIGEIQLGTEYRRCLSGTSEAFIRTAWASQYWSGVADDDEEDFGLTGFVLAFGLTR